MMFLNIKNRYLTQGLLALALFASQSIFSGDHVDTGSYQQLKQRALAPWVLALFNKELDGLKLPPADQANAALLPIGNQGFQEPLMQVSKKELKTIRSSNRQKAMIKATAGILGGMLVGGILGIMDWRFCWCFPAPNHTFSHSHDFIAGPVIGALLGAVLGTIDGEFECPRIAECAEKNLQPVADGKAWARFPQFTKWLHARYSPPLYVSASEAGEQDLLLNVMPALAQQ